MTEGEVEASQIEGPPGLAMVQFLGRSEVLQVLMVGPNLHRMLGSLQKVSPLLQCTNNGQHLLVMDLVVPLHLTQALRVECNRVPLVIFSGLLGEDRPSGHVGAIHLNPERPVTIRKCQDQGGCDFGLQGLEGCLLRASPPPWAVLLGQVKQGACKVREALNKAPVKVDEAQEGLHLSL